MDGWMDGWTDGWMGLKKDEDGTSGGQANGGRVIRIDTCCFIVWAACALSGWKGWMDRWMDR